MNGVTFSAGDLTTAIGSSNTLASAFAETITSNAGWLILIATAGLIVFFVLYLMRRLRRLGRG